MATTPTASKQRTRLVQAQTTLDAAINQARLYGAPDPEAAPVMQDAFHSTMWVRVQP